MYNECKIEKQVNINSFYTIFYEKLLQDYRFPGESHNFWELVCILTGKAGVTAGSNVFVLEEGQCILHPPTEFHSIWSAMDTEPEIVIFSFGADITHRPPKYIFNTNTAQQRTILNLALESETVFEKDYVNVLRVKNDCTLKAQRLVNTFELLLISLFENSSEHTSESIIKSGEKYSAIVRCMEKNIENNISISELASLCRMSEASLKKTFKKYSGMSVGIYFNTMKMNRAAELIKEGMSVSEASATLGFSDPNYFSTAFKRICGYSPGQLKKQ